MPLPNLPFGILITSKQLISGLHINNLTYLLTGTATNLTATPAGTNVTSLALNSWSNEVTTVANANDGVLLPLAKSGLRVIVTNSGAGNSLRVFANPNDNIKGAAQADLAQNASSMFVCWKDGTWKQLNFA